MVYQELSYGSFPTGERPSHVAIARWASPGSLPFLSRFFFPYTVSAHARSSWGQNRAPPHQPERRVDCLQQYRNENDSPEHPSRTSM